MSIHVTSRAFGQDDRIPDTYTVEGADVSPPLEWTNVPKDARELVLICEDPDAPTPKPYVHWIVAKIPPETTSLPEGVPREPVLETPAGAIQGANSWPSDNIGYRGPAPPPRHGRHRYYFKIFATDKVLDISPGITRDEIYNLIRGHVIAEGSIMGTYSR